MSDNSSKRRGGLSGLGKTNRQPRTPEEQLEIDVFTGGAALKSGAVSDQIVETSNPVDMMAMLEKMTHAARPQPIQGRMVSMEQGYHDLVDEMTYLAPRTKISRSDVIRAGLLALSKMSDTEAETMLKAVSENSVNALLRDKRYQAITSDK